VSTSTAGRFVGQSVKRREDPRLLTGHGQYVDDVMLPGMLHCTFVRSDVARGRIVRVDTEAARALDGVFAVLTASDLNHHAGTMQPTLLMTTPGAPLRPLADGDVRFVGEPIVLIVAESRYVAEDGAELVEVEIDSEPAVVDAEHALDDDAPIVHPELGTNLGAEMAFPVAAELEAVLHGENVVRRTFRRWKRGGSWSRTSRPRAS
jgi:aerobic carbon-monoxide dehydrogenase large subunit